MISKYIGIEIEANKEDRDEYFDIKKVKIQTTPNIKAEKISKQQRIPR